MWLTKNEKAVLNLLLDDANISDIFIAEKLKISSQAVGRIKKRLEKDIIRGYTINLNSKLLGVNIVALFKISFNQSIENFDVSSLEKKLKELPEVTMMFKTLSGSHDYIFLASFSNLDDLEKFVTEKRNGKPFDSFFIIKELIALPTSCVLKKSEKNLLKKMIDDCRTKSADFK